MQTYKNISGDSGVQSYEIGLDFIIVKFKEKSTGVDTYKYTYNSAGESAVEQMKTLAASGSGLQSYINTEVRDKYEGKQ